MRGFKQWYIRNKYGNQKIATADGKFDSKLELNQYDYLRWLERAGRIKDLQRQVRIKLGNAKECRVAYIADFAYFDCEREIFVLHDSKGFETKEFILKKKWLLDSYGGFILRVAFKNETIDYKPFNDSNPLPNCFLKGELK